MNRGWRERGFGPSGMVAALALASCLVGAETVSSQAIACTLEARPGIAVEVRGAASGAPAVQGALAEASDGLHSFPLETVEWETDDPASAYVMEGVHERPGEYTVTVTRNGYRPWVASGVRVSGWSCHVSTVRLKA